MAVHGLYVGINYEGTSAALAGCIPDAHRRERQFSRVVSSAVKLLENQATMAGILAALDEMLAKLKTSDDCLIICRSGHGTQGRDDGSDESDRKDEAFCPFDYRSNLLWDDIWAERINRRKTGWVLTLDDCCHSGTGHRKLTDIAEIDPQAKRRFLPFHEIVAGMCSSDARRLLHHDRPKRRRDAAQAGWVHFSGCKDNEFSYDAVINGKPCGAFTHYSAETWDGLKVGNDFPEWRDRTRKYLNGSGKYPQTPQLVATTKDALRIVPGYEPAVQPPPAPVEAAGPGVPVIVGGWRAKTWERDQ